MQILEIDKNTFFSFLTNKDNKCIGQGCYGIVSKYNNNTLIKLYYKDFIETYISRDINELDKEFNTRIEVLNIIKCNSEHKDNDIECDELAKKKEYLLEKIGFLKGIVLYRGLKVGILINYYKNFIDLKEIFYVLQTNEQLSLLNKIKEQIIKLNNLNLYPMDLKEDNILVNPKTLDIAFIDLDDLYTRYEEMQYIKEHNLRLKEKCFDRYSEMEMRLTKRNDKSEEML